MRISTKRTLARFATAAAVACAAVIVLLPGTASAATTATATGTVAIREFASNSSDAVDTLYVGESVSVQGCKQGWCYITHTGPDGFVPATFLKTGSGMVGPNFNLSFNFPNGSFSFGNGGISIGIGNGDDEEEDVSQACFYSGSGYTGSRFCVDEGQSIRNLPSSWNNRISSFRNPDGLRVTVCKDSGYSNCRVYTTSARTLGTFNDAISSIRVR